MKSATQTIMQSYAMSEKSRKTIQRIFFRSSGIFIADNKNQLIVSRLQAHMLSLGFDDFDEYANYLEKHYNEKERITAIDLLTTNETYFFREPEHFKKLRELILPSIQQRPVRIWCAAASSGEEPYSIAMILAEHFGFSNWELIASDISYRMLEKAEAGLYPMQRLEQMPEEYLRKYCRKGVAQYDGMLRVREELRNRVKFVHHNLLNDASAMGMFDIIFIRNVMIYFDTNVKNIVLHNLCRQLRPDSWLITSHSESLIGNNYPLKVEVPSIYRRTAA